MRFFRLQFLGLLILLLVVGCADAQTPTPTSTEAVAEAPPTAEPATETPSPLPPTHTPPPPTATATPTATVTPSPTATATPSVPERVEAATVRILVEGSPYLEEYIHAGSGVIFDHSGLVLTNYHLIEGAGILQLSLPDGTILPAQLLGRSACDDVAVLQLAGSDFPSLPIDTEVAIAGPALAAGYPWGSNAPQIEEVVIAGEPVTGTLGFMDTFSSTLRLDGSLDLGFTGGPVVSDSGTLLGLLAVIQQGEVPVANLIPAAELDRLLSLVFDEQRNWIGLNVGPIPADAADNENAPVEATAGLLVYAIDLRGPAADAGVRAGDVLSVLAGQSLTADNAMQAYCQIVRAHVPGEPLDMVVERGSDRYLGQLNGDVLEKELIVLPPTSTPAPVVESPPPPPPEDSAGGSLLDAATDMRGAMSSLGGTIDGLVAASNGCLGSAPGSPITVAGVPLHASCIHKASDCQKIVGLHGRVVNAPEFDPNSLTGAEVSAYNSYQIAKTAFASGTTELIGACSSLIANPEGNVSISNLVVAQARQKIGEAIEIISRVVASLQ